MDLCSLLKTGQTVKFIVAGTLTGLMWSVSAMAIDMPELAKKNKCDACHSIEKRMVGPAWIDVAKKYKGDAGAANRLIAKVSGGGLGVWGRIPMPPQDPSAAKQDEIKQLVQFVLSLEQ